MTAAGHHRDARRPLRLARLWHAIGWLLLAVLLLAMVLPAPPLDVDVEGADKSVHVLAFAVVSAWYSLIYPPSPALARCALGLLAFAVFTELLQVAIPWRSGDLADLIADAAGIVLGFSVAYTPLSRTLLRIEASCVKD